MDACAWCAYGGHNDITEVLLKDGADVMAADEVSTEMIDSRIDNV